MKGRAMNAHELQVLSRLFSYPDTPPDPHDLPGLENKWSRGRGNRKLRNLQAEYVRLFINALPEVPCPPYGSFYLEGTLMGESTVKIRNLYLSYGIEPTEMADHATVELEFLAFLAALPPEAPVREDSYFLLGHLDLWLPEFLDRVEKNDQLGFYRDVSRYAKAVLNDRSMEEAPDIG